MRPAERAAAGRNDFATKTARVMEAEAMASMRAAMSGRSIQRARDSREISKSLAMSMSEASGLARASRISSSILALIGRIET